MKVDCSAVIDIVLGMQEAVVALRDCFGQVLDLVDREHLAIKNHDLDGVEDIASAKLELGQKIEKNFTQLKQETARLVTQYNEVASEPCASLATLSDSFGLIEKLLEHYGQNAALSQVFAQLKNQFLEFMDQRAASQEQVELNKVVLSKVLTNRQENYRFWQEVASDMMSAYDQEGKQQAKNRRSILSVKA